jgi:6-pyruvoyl-tetrahydropterin synthase
MATLTFSHDIQVAHRLWRLPGKCQNIHGHSMTVHITLLAPVVDDVIGGWDFHDIKKVVRHHLDTEYDHRLLLNSVDPWAQPLGLNQHLASNNRSVIWPIECLPGLKTFENIDPTTENIAKAIWKWAKQEFDAAEGHQVVVRETANTAIMIGWNGA